MPREKPKKNERDLLRELKLRCGVPRGFAELDLSEMEHGGNKAYRGQLSQMEELATSKLDTADFLRDPVFLYVSGPFGSGKTRLLTGLLKRAYRGLLSARPGLITPRFSPLFVRAVNLVELRFRPHYGEEEAEDALLRERIFSSTFLAIDDVGRLNDFRGEMNYIELVVEERYDEGLSTALSSNLGEAGLKEKAPRFLDFLSYFETATLTCASWRGVNTNAD